MHISARNHFMSTARALLFIGMLLLSLFALAHALTIESITVVRANSAEQTTLTPGSATITADGTSTQVLTVTAKDANGNNMTTGGADIAITKSSGTGTIGSVTDNGNGTYSATVTSPTTIGSGIFVATIAGAPVKGGTGTQSEATVTYIAGTSTKIVIESAADGSGSAITTKSLVSGSAFTAYAISRDASSNFVANVAATWSLTGKDGGVADGDLVAVAEGKSAVFTAHLIGTATVQAVSGSLNDDTGLVTVTNGIASKLAFTTQPSASTVSGAAFAQQPVVTVQDAAGNTVTDATDSITLTLTTGTGSLGGMLVMNAVNGVADFTGKGVNIDLAGTDKVLTASSGILTTATTSPAFSITLQVVNIAAIPGVIAPVKGATPVTTITATDQYTGTVSWSPTRTGTIFGPFTSYTATIILAPKPGFTLTGVAADLFTVAGAAPVNNPVNSGVVTAVFPATAQVSIGDSFGGGKVFYIDGSKQHGLIAATANQNEGLQWWNGSSTITGATGTAIGTGASNTAAIIFSQGPGSYAAKLCDDYSVTVDGVLYDDWYLPSIEELNRLFINKGAVGGFDNCGYFWSSSEYNAVKAFYMDICGDHWGGTPGILFGVKSSNPRVRAVRSF